MSSAGAGEQGSGPSASNRVVRRRVAHKQAEEIPCMRLTVLICALLLGACAGSPHRSARMFPLLAGAGTASEIRRVDIDDHKLAPPALAFEVDCTALPYAKGEERDFCYQWGSWGVFIHERGILVACNCGEFGGFVLWYSKRGELLQTLIAGDIPQTLISDADALVCVTGISHLSMSEGAIETFRLVNDRWQPVASTKLAREVERVDIVPDGSLVIRLTQDGRMLRYRAGVLEKLPMTACTAATFNGSCPGVAGTASRCVAPCGFIGTTSCLSVDP